MGFGVVSVVVVVEDVVVAAVAAALVLCVVEVEDADPHALTIRVSRTAASGMRRCFMVLSRTPVAAGCFPEVVREFRPSGAYTARSRGPAPAPACAEDLNRG